MRPVAIALFAVATAAACEVPPKHVERNDVQQAALRGRLKTVCKGLEMKDDEVREFAAEKLAEVDNSISSECVCRFLPHPTRGWDAFIAKGLKGSKREDFAACLADLVRKPDLPERAAAVTALARIAAPSTPGVLAELAGDPSVAADARVAALASISGTSAHRDLFLRLLSGDAEPSVRAAAAEAAWRIKDDAVGPALLDAFQKDADPAVRGAALSAAMRAGLPGTEEMVCKAMMEDPSPEVRRQAISALRGTRRDAAVACLRERALTEETDPDVRDELLQTLKSSPHDGAALALCDAIPYWMRTYVVTDIPEKTPGTGIIKIQNDRDWDRTYECLEKALRQSGGYSCYARMYVAGWFKIVGGSAFVPKCPGYEDKEVVIGG